MKPEQIYSTYENTNGLPQYTQDTLSFDGEDIFPSVVDTDDEKEVLWVPLTKHPTDPTDGRKMLPAKPPENTSVEVFKKVLSGAFQVYLESGRLVYDRIAEVCGVQVPTIRAVMQTEEFGYALAIRGVDTKGVGNLTPQQDAALMILTDIGSRLTWGGKLKAAGISQATFTAWMKNPTFSRRFSGLAEEITANSSVALVQLGQKVGEGDFNAIKFQLAISGRYSESAQTVADIMVIINRVLESLATHLSADHPEVLKAVATDMRMLAESVTQQKVIQVIEG